MNYSNCQHFIFQYVQNRVFRSCSRGHAVCPTLTLLMLIMFYPHKDNYVVISTHYLSWCGPTSAFSTKEEVNISSSPSAQRGFGLILYQCSLSINMERCRYHLWRRINHAIFYATFDLGLERTPPSLSVHHHWEVYIYPALGADENSRFYY